MMDSILHKSPEIRHRWPPVMDFFSVMYRASQIDYEPSVMDFDRHGCPGSPLSPLWARLSPVTCDEIFSSQIGYHVGFFSITDLSRHVSSHVFAKVYADVSSVPRRIQPRCFVAQFGFLGAFNPLLFWANMIFLAFQFFQWSFFWPFSGHAAQFKLGCFQILAQLKLGCCQIQQNTNISSIILAKLITNYH